MDASPGYLVLLGSGETSATGRRIFEWLLQRITPPVRIAILETPAGFQPNSGLVAQKIADFLHRRLSNYAIETTIVPARRRGTSNSPDDPGLADLVLGSTCIFLGPGSPTYAVRQLRHSQVWDATRVRYFLGGAIVLSSAAVLAAGAFTLPVYEIYKAGADLNWETGLDLLPSPTAPLVFIPHWNNREGGAELDTSHCFVGQERFALLQALLPVDAVIVGIDEHTALVLERGSSTARVLGLGRVHVHGRAGTGDYGDGGAIPLAELGRIDWAVFAASLPPALVARARELDQPRDEGQVPEVIPSEVLDLVDRREAARRRRDWETADALRREVEQFGYRIEDTPVGPRLRPGTPRANR
jgi:cyanophycinase-like exopeptidase